MFSPDVSEDDIAFYRPFPKVHLHSHVLGMIPEELVRAMAKKNGVHIAAEPERFYDYYDFATFLNILMLIASTMCDEEDFSAVGYELVRDAHSDNVLYSELFFGPTMHLLFGVPYRTMVDGLTHGIARGEAEFGVTVRLIAGLSKQVPPAVGTNIVRQMIAHPSSYVIGIGLEDYEPAGATEGFVEAYALARANGLHCTAHAGEHGPGENVIKALGLLGCERIDHGYRAATEPAIAYRLADNGVHFTACPTVSSRQGWGAGERHILQDMHELGMWISLNSDDPAVIKTTLSRECALAEKFMKVDRQTILGINRRSIDATWLSSSEKVALRTRFDVMAAQAAGTSG